MSVVELCSADDPLPWGGTWDLRSWDFGGSDFWSQPLLAPTFRAAFP